MLYAAEESQQGPTASYLNCHATICCVEHLCVLLCEHPAGRGMLPKYAVPSLFLSSPQH
jgi:hypothetical protein